MNPEFRNYRSRIESDSNSGPKFRAIKPYGREDWVLNNSNLCMKILTVKFRKSCGLHYHIKKEKIFFIVKGSIIFDWIDINSEEENTITLYAGDSVYIPTGLPHGFAGADEGNTIIVESSTHNDPQDNYSPGDS